MVTDKKRIGDLHADHKAWFEESGFYADELKIFGERLTEIAGKNTGAEISKKIEHFQNQFIIQKEQLDGLNHEARVHEQQLSTYAGEHPVAVDHKLFKDHAGFREKAAAFKKIYAELKTEYNRFLSEVM